METFHSQRRLQRTQRRRTRTAGPLAQEWSRWCTDSVQRRRLVGRKMPRRPWPNSKKPCDPTTMKSRVSSRAIVQVASRRNSRRN